MNEQENLIAQKISIIANLILENEDCVGKLNLLSFEITEYDVVLTFMDVTEGAQDGMEITFFPTEWLDFDLGHIFKLISEA